jgi:hypothetical protein
MMEDRFVLWLKIMSRQGFLDAEEINKILSGDKATAEALWKDFVEYDKTAVRDFVFDVFCSNSIELVRITSQNLK